MIDKYGHWEVIGEEFKDEKSRKIFLVRCVCGVEKKVQSHHLKSGRSTNCGCKHTNLGGFEDRRKQIIDFLKKGYTVRDILANVYTSFSTISKIRKEMNIRKK